MRRRPRIDPIAQPAAQPGECTALPSGECTGLRLVVTRAGFFQLDTQTKRRKHATCKDVIAAMERAAAQKDSSTPLAVAAAPKLPHVRELAADLASGVLSEGEVARKLCMVIGPSVELAVTAAVAVQSSALKRARQRLADPAPSGSPTGTLTSCSSRASASAAEEVCEDGCDVSADALGPSRLLRRASGRSVGAARSHPYAPVAPLASMGVRRRSSRLALGTASSSSGLTPALGNVTLSFDETDKDAAVEAAHAAFNEEAAVVRAKALLERAARRAEAAQLVQAAARARQPHRQ